jgi:hypothetical protein
LLIRIGLNADPYPAFYLNANPDQDPRSLTNADPDPCRTENSQKIAFFMKNILKVCKR